MGNAYREAGCATARGCLLQYWRGYRWGAAAHVAPYSGLSITTPVRSHPSHAISTRIHSTSSLLKLLCQSVDKIMFRKQLNDLKTSAPLRSSDRKKLRLRVLHSFGLTDADSAHLANLLVPDGIQSVKFSASNAQPAVRSTSFFNSTFKSQCIHHRSHISPPKETLSGSPSANSLQTLISYLQVTQHITRMNPSHLAYTGSLYPMEIPSTPSFSLHPLSRHSRPIRRRRPHDRRRCVPPTITIIFTLHYTTTCTNPVPL